MNKRDKTDLLPCYHGAYILVEAKVKYNVVQSMVIDKNYYYDY